MVQVGAGQPSLHSVLEQEHIVEVRIGEGAGVDDDSIDTINILTASCSIKTSSENTSSSMEVVSRFCFILSKTGLASYSQP